VTGQQPQRYARVPAEMSRESWRRDAGHVAECGALAGRGTSAAAALDDLGRQLAAAAARGAEDSPSVRWDAANRSLWVSVPDVLHGGYTDIAVHFDAAGAPCRWYGGSSGGGPARTAHAGAAGMSEVPGR
jgi:hypothetical protein